MFKCFWVSLSTQEEQLEYALEMKSLTLMVPTSLQIRNVSHLVLRRVDHSLRLINKTLKSQRLRLSQVAEHPPVQLDFASTKARYKVTIGHIMLPASRVYSCDPQTAKDSWSLAPVSKGLMKIMHDPLHG